jgi:hypothetical protein
VNIKATEVCKITFRKKVCVPDWFTVTDFSLVFHDPSPISQHLFDTIVCRHVTQRVSVRAEYHTWWTDSR